jgi:hypothetical protein
VKSLFFYLYVNQRTKQSFDSSVETHTIGEQVPSFDWSCKAKWELRRASVFHPET